MIDLHCHILPDIDDGPPDIEESLKMARLAVEDGTRVMVATPHITHTLHSPELIAEKVAALQQRLVEDGVELKILAGAECQYNLTIDHLQAYALNGGDHVLLECPHAHLPLQIEDAIFSALSQGLQPILAHPERNPTIIRNPRRLLELVERGVLVQVTAGSLLGEFGSAERECSRYLLKKGAVHCLASDGHSAGWRAPLLAKAHDVAAKLIGAEQAHDLVDSNPRHYLGLEG